MVPSRDVLMLRLLSQQSVIAPINKLIDEGTDENLFQEVAHGNPKNPRGLAAFAGHGRASGS
jgi:hypothetical protein